MSKSRGLLMTFIIALIATIMGSKFPVIGSAIFAIVIGILLNNFIEIPKNIVPVSNLVVKSIAL